MSVCLYACLSDDNFRKIWRRKFIFSHATYLHGLLVKFVYEGHQGHGSQKGRKSLFSQCKTSIGNNFRSVVCVQNGVWNGYLRATWRISSSWNVVNGRTDLLTGNAGGKMQLAFDLSTLNTHTHAHAPSHTQLNSIQRCKTDAGAKAPLYPYLR